MKFSRSARILPGMGVVHRLVIVIAAFGALFMWWIIHQSPQDHMGGGLSLLIMALPGIAAAAVLYPICWIVAGPRLFRRR